MALKEIQDELVVKPSKRRKAKNGRRKGRGPRTAPGGDFGSVVTLAAGIALGAVLGLAVGTRRD